MAKGFTRTQHATDNISFPVLTYTDALPRKDLYELDDGTSYKRPDPATLGQWDFHRPSTADGYRKPPPGQSAMFDFRVTAPPDEAVPTRSRPYRGPKEQESIGIALGSPGMLHSQGQFQPPISIFAAGRTGEKSGPQKSSKWKKIGGFFRAKSALASTSNLAQADPGLRTTRKEKSSEKPRKTKQRNDSKEEWPSLKIDPKPELNASGKIRESKRNRNRSQTAPQGPEGKSASTEPMLQVNIPDIEMERYSVMFSNFIQKRERPSLLARRDKTLDNLQVPDAHNFLKAKGSPVIQRRATSPARTSFTLFPTSQPTKAAQVLGALGTGPTPNFSRGPRVRASTLPAESPLKAPEEQPKDSANVHILTAFESPVIPRVFMERRSSTPRSSTSTPRNEDKPLPAIKPESKPARTHQHTSLKNGDAITSKIYAPKQDTPRKDTPKKNTPKKGTPKDTPQKHTPKNQSRIPVKTEKRPSPPAKDKTLSTSITTEKVGRIIVSTMPISGPDCGSSPEDSTRRMPLADEDTSPLPYISPAVEVSTAKSVSVSQGRRQLLVPIGARVDHLEPHERLVDRQTLIPSVQSGHKHAVSQELRIESL
ncbi:hypothetical protein N7474_002237 [Penicillium riverlandense]|uniref:uncharacterized protein n=1 Tax=Penicillium riverlandense TaxID=1903569 RepID=UPI002549A419|nr:uncharacterized protein N7474_002237 [Penicillium riverlandense]KAJ5833926.1 hypothetical protein N7474_002237 [Penicillium riverlandense]